MITNLIKLPIVLHALRCTSTKKDLSEMGYNALKRVNAISSARVILFRHVRWWTGPQPWPVNNGVSVDLIRQGEVFRGLIEIAVGNCSEMGLPDFSPLFTVGMMRDFTLLFVDN